MTQQEFETRTGRTVTPEVYAKIEKIYMQTTIDKDIFCQNWVGGLEENPIVDNLATRTEIYTSAFDSHAADSKKTAFHLIDIAQGLTGEVKEELESVAWSMISRKVFTLYKIEKAYTLTDSDRQYIKKAVESYI